MNYPLVLLTLLLPHSLNGKPKASPCPFDADAFGLVLNNPFLLRSSI